MGLQINTNVAALNAYRNLNGTQGSMQTSLERLSSGLRINRAADDAAGLAISEKLRSQVNGLNQAQANAQDGVSLIQTAEGALNEVHSILQRMRTLAVQSTSDTNTDADRAAIQKEVDALVKEVNSTTERTQFNGMNLLDGSFSGKSLQIGANFDQAMGVSINKMDAKGLGLTDVTVNSFTATTTAITAGTASDGGYLKANTTYEVKDNGGTLEVWEQGGAKAGNIDSDGLMGNGTDGVTITGTIVDGYVFKTGTLPTVGVSSTVTTQEATIAGKVPADAYIATANSKTGGYDLKNGAGDVAGSLSADGKTATFTAGGTARFLDDASAGFTIAAAAGTDPKFNLDLSTQNSASKSILYVDSAIKAVSDQRADLGALQNRLSHTINNLGVASENLAASESRIRDTDMAKEMTNFTRSQILQQAGVSMLAQANQSAQSVLKLLG